MRTPFRHDFFLVTSFVVVLFVGLSVAAQGSDQTPPTTGGLSERSGGSYQLRQSSAGVVIGPHSGQEADTAPISRATGIVFDGPDFDDNSDETGGWLFIPPDPISAAGPGLLVAVVNVKIIPRSAGGNCCKPAA